MTTPEYMLVPYQGAEPITFDMLPLDVERVAGRALSVRTTSLGERAETRGPVSIRYSKDDGRVVEIGLVHPAQLIFHGRDLLEGSDPTPFLLTLGDRPYEGHGFLVFPKLGITTTGFHDGDESQKAITVFRRGRWDRHMARLKPWTA